MIDILMIMLVFFMVTSTYFNLSMLPLVQTEDTAATAQSPKAGEAARGPLLLRLTGESEIMFQGERLNADALRQRLMDVVQVSPGVQVLVLPSPRASVQALVSALDTATAAGVTRVRLVQLDGAE